MHQLILQDRHVIYREIETILGISGTSIHSILPEHLTVKKKICWSWIPHKFVNRSKKEAHGDLSQEILQKHNRGTSKHGYEIVTSYESWIYAYVPESKQQSTVWVFQDEPNPTKVAHIGSTSKQMVACFFRKNRTCRNRTTRTTQNSQF